MAGQSAVAHRVTRLLCIGLSLWCVCSWLAPLPLGRRVPPGPAGAAPLSQGLPHPVPHPLPAGASYRDLVRSYLVQDLLQRRAGVGGGLHPLSSLRLPDPACWRWTWDDSVPVLVPRGLLPAQGEALAGCGSCARSVSSFRSAVSAAHPWVLELVGPQVVVAGGFVSCLLDGNARQVKDVDLFLVGVTAEQADRQIERIANLLRDRWGTLMVFRTNHCLTLRPSEPLPTVAAPSGDPCCLSPPYVQVILRLHSHVSEVLHGFDLGSSCCAWDGREVWFSGMGKLAYEHRANVLDLSRERDATYQPRLAKYFSRPRGFAIVLPGLDVPAFARTFWPWNTEEQDDTLVHKQNRAAARTQPCIGQLEMHELWIGDPGSGPCGSTLLLAGALSPTRAALATDADYDPSRLDRKLLMQRNLRAAQERPVQGHLLCGWARWRGCDSDPSPFHFRDIVIRWSGAAPPHIVRSVRLNPHYQTGMDQDITQRANNQHDITERERAFYVLKTKKG